MTIYIYRMNVKDKFYIGSTKDIKHRIRTHKYNCYNQNCKEYNIKVYKYIRDNCANWTEVSFNILDVYDDISSEFKREIEQYYIEYFCNNLNTIGANSSDIKIKKRREKVQCECGKVVAYGNISSHRKTKFHQKRLVYPCAQYKSQKEYAKQYYEKNKLNEKVQCACGRFVARRNIVRHKKTKTHQKFLNK